MKTKNILVTGAGALLGQGILRMLQLAKFPKKIFTADPESKSTGHWLGQHSLLIPLANDPKYIESIRDIVLQYQIDCILVGTDVELPVLSNYKEEFQLKHQCTIVVSNRTVIDIANDKYLTSRFLKENGHRYPRSARAASTSELNKLVSKVGFPLFAKPRDGARSIGIKKIANQQELATIHDPKSNMVIQEYLDSSDGEYTSGCLVVENKCVAVITLRRDLRDGNTYRAYRDEACARFDSTLACVAESLQPNGPANFQFRVVDDEPVIFEINGRFSGTTPIRYMFGFNEVEALLLALLYGTTISQPILNEGVVMRTWSDLFVEWDQLEKLDRERENKNPLGKNFDFSLLDR